DALRGALRGGDEAYRTGGDEFALLLRETRREDIPVITERAVAAGGPSFSWGAATYPFDGSEVHRLVEVADHRLYQARSTRRGAPPTAVPGAAPARPRPTRWAPRQLPARLLQAGVLVAPIVAAIAVAVVLSRALPASSGWGEAAGWFAVVILCSAFAAAAVDAAARR